VGAGNEEALFSPRLPMSATMARWLTNVMSRPGGRQRPSLSATTRPADCATSARETRPSSETEVDADIRSASRSRHGRSGLACRIAFPEQAAFPAVTFLTSACGSAPGRGFDLRYPVSALLSWRRCFAVADHFPLFAACWSPHATSAATPAITAGAFSRFHLNSELDSIESGLSSPLVATLPGSGSMRRGSVIPSLADCGLVLGVGQP
jgi:hypothetical protein